MEHPGRFSHFMFRVNSSSRVINKRFSGLLRGYFLSADHPMKLRLWHWMRLGLGYARLAVPYGTGTTITLDERDHVQREIFIKGHYEPEVWECINQFAVSKEEIFWDIGAHIGTFSIKAQVDERFKEAHAFEPDPITMSILALNSMLNRGCCHLHQIALSARSEKKILMHGPEGNTGVSNLTLKVYSDKSFEVECISADDLIYKNKMNPPTILKIDVEGWELNVLKGASRLLSENSPKAIIFEAECNDAGELIEEEIVNLLRRFNYKIKRLLRHDGSLYSRENYIAEQIS